MFKHRLLDEPGGNFLPRSGLPSELCGKQARKGTGVGSADSDIRVFHRRPRNRFLVEKL